jgi:hypothetical protein
MAHSFTACSFLANKADLLRYILRHIYRHFDCYEKLKDGAVHSFANIVDRAAVESPMDGTFTVLANTENTGPEYQTSG